jgi:DNA repair exonuclease SbcCD nuclease subunit
MIKVLFFSDSHLGFDYPIRPRIDRRRRGQDFFDNHRRVLKFANDNDIDLVIHGGDFFFRSKIPKQIIDIAYRDLLEFAAYGIPIAIVPGNHERSRLPESLLMEHPGIFIFDQVRTFYFEMKGTSIAVSGFPFIRDNIRDNFPKILKYLNINGIDTDVKLICMHQAIEGTQVGPANYTFRYGKDVIRQQDLPLNYDCILCGHIHRQQILWIKRDNKTVPVIYPGSIERTSFAEKDEEKGFYLLEFNEEKIKPGFNSLKFIPLPARPMIDLTLSVDTDSPAEFSNAVKTYINKIPLDAIVRLHCPSDRTKSILTAKFIRDTFPATMNVQLAGMRDYVVRLRKNYKS